MAKAEESSKKAISYPVKILYWNGIPQIRPDGGNEEELYSFISQFQENTKLNITLSEEDINTIERVSYQKGYEQAEKDHELTIKDLELLHTFLYAVKNNKHGAFTFTRLSDEQYNEVLRRFEEAKK